MKTRDHKKTIKPTLVALQALTVILCVVQDSVSFLRHRSGTPRTRIGYETPGSGQLPQLDHGVHAGRQQVLGVTGEPDRHHLRDTVCPVKRAEALVTDAVPQLNVTVRRGGGEDLSV